MNLGTFAVWLPAAWAGFFYSSEEWYLLLGLAVVGLLLLACLVRPLIQAIGFLEGSKKLRGERGRALLRRMVSPTRYPGVWTRGQSLRGHDLRGEDLKDAFLADVDLSDTDLRGVDLSGANLGGAYLVGARYDDGTRWPDGFDPVKAGAVKVG